MPGNLAPIQPQCTDFRSVARALTIVENSMEGAGELLKGLVFKKNTPVIGITGPPGAGKSTLVNTLIGHLLTGGKKVAVLAVDPTSPFNFGSLLGDRIRMAAHFNHPDVFIRSLAARGSLGGLSAKTIEMTDVLRGAGFDFVIIETVGVGQSEVEIAGLADLTFLVLVPESGDDVQNMKSGLMEIADAFIVNKADRADAGLFANNLVKILHQNGSDDTPVFKTVATTGEGIMEVAGYVLSPNSKKNDRKAFLQAERAYRIIQQKRMENVDRKKLAQQLKEAMKDNRFNLYTFLDSFYN